MKNQISFLAFGITLAGAIGLLVSPALGWFSLMLVGGIIGFGFPENKP